MGGTPARITGTAPQRARTSLMSRRRSRVHRPRARRRSVSFTPSATTTTSATTPPPGRAAPRAGGGRGAVAAQHPPVHGPPRRRRQGRRDLPRQPFAVVRRAHARRRGLAQHQQPHGRAPAGNLARARAGRLGKARRGGTDAPALAHQQRRQQRRCRARTRRGEGNRARPAGCGERVDHAGEERPPRSLSIPRAKAVRAVRESGLREFPAANHAACRSNRLIPGCGRAVASSALNRRAAESAQADFVSLLRRIHSLGRRTAQDPIRPAISIIRSGWDAAIRSGWPGVRFPIHPLRRA